MSKEQQLIQKKIDEITRSHLKAAVFESVEACRGITKRGTYVQIATVATLAELCCWAFGAMSEEENIPEENYMEKFMKGLFENVREGIESRGRKNKS